jgi:hypothetical protein
VCENPRHSRGLVNNHLTPLLIARARAFVVFVRVSPLAADRTSCTKATANQFRRHGASARKRNHQKITRTWSYSRRNGQSGASK